MSSHEDLVPEDEAVEPLLTFEDVAEILGVSRAHVYRLAEHEGLPTVRLSDRVQRVREFELEEWLSSRPRHRSSSTSAGG